MDSARTALSDVEVLRDHSRDAGPAPDLQRVQNVGALPYRPGMAHDIQVTVDCARPHELADWWAEALGWSVEPQDEAFIRSMVEAGHATEADTTTHRGTLVWRQGAALVSPDPGRPRVLFQEVPEAKAGKNRLHLDVRVASRAREAEATRLVGLGARELWRASQGPLEWITLADPEGNEFCLT